jgi:pimeloyl-ACP methyl ester carboxylesterase
MTAAPGDGGGKPAGNRLTGVRGMFDVLRNLGFLPGTSARDPELLRFTADDGQPIPVYAAGHGLPVVFLHGLGCSHRHWKAVARRMRRRHAVYAWDARGHGGGRPLIGEPVTLRRLARDLAQLLAHFALDRAVLVGHSMGALTVMQYLNDHGPGRILAFCLVDQSPRVVTDQDWRLGLFGDCSAQMLCGLIEGARQDLSATVMREISAAAGRASRWLGPQAFPGRLLHGWLKSLEVQPLLDLCESLVAADFRDLLPSVNRPLMVVLGGRSAHYAHVPLAEYYRAVAPGVEVHRYEAAGHSPHFAEPARFAADLERFIAAVQ